MNAVDELRALAAQDQEITGKLSGLCLPLAHIEIIYRIPDGFTGEFEDILIHRGEEPGVSLIFDHNQRKICLEVHPLLLRERTGGQ